MPWRTLQDIRKENIERERRAASTPPTECPIDGSPLQVRARDGVRNCPFGNFTWTGGPAGAGANPGV